jgi:hypothetical protein
MISQKAIADAEAAQTLSNPSGNVKLGGVGAKAGAALSGWF